MKLLGPASTSSWVVPSARSTLESVVVPSSATIVTSTRAADDGAETVRRVVQPLPERRPGTATGTRRAGVEAEYVTSGAPRDHRSTLRTPATTGTSDVM